MPITDPNMQNANNPHAQHPPQGVNDGATGGADQVDTVDSKTNVEDADLAQDVYAADDMPLSE